MDRWEYVVVYLSETRPTNQKWETLNTSWERALNLAGSHGYELQCITTVSSGNNFAVLKRKVEADD